MRFYRFTLHYYNYNKSQYQFTLNSHLTSYDPTYKYTVIRLLLLLFLYRVMMMVITVVSKGTPCDYDYCYFYKYHMWWWVQGYCFFYDTCITDDEGYWWSKFPRPNYNNFQIQNPKMINIPNYVRLTSRFTYRINTLT